MRLSTERWVLSAIALISVCGAGLLVKRHLDPPRRGQSALQRPERREQSLLRRKASGAARRARGGDETAHELGVSRRSHDRLEPRRGATRPERPRPAVPARTAPFSGPLYRGDEDEEEFTDKDVDRLVENDILTPDMGREWKEWLRRSRRPQRTGH